jgi:uncharacterized protein YybS (DUF2232 family)
MQGRIFDIVKGSVATATLFLAFFMLPGLGIIPGMFAATPAVFYGLKGGRKTGAAIVVATSVILAVVADPVAVVIYLLQAGVMSLALPEFLVRLKGGGRSILYSVAINLVCGLVAVALYSQVTGSNLHDKVTKGVQSSITQTTQLYQKAGVKGDELKVMQESMQRAGELIIVIYPALVTVSLGIIACINVALVRALGSRARMPVYVGDFAKFRTPDPLIWFLIAAGFGMLVQQNLVYLVSLNLLIVVCTVYAVQGLAVITHFFRRIAVPKFIRLLGCLFLILQPFMVLAVAALGVFDLWGDFRSPNKKNL